MCPEGAVGYRRSIFANIHKAKNRYKVSGWSKWVYYLEKYVFDRFNVEIGKLNRRTACRVYCDGLMR